MILLLLILVPLVLLSPLNGHAFQNSCMQAESGRYQVYVGNACPWCHRVLLALAITGLDKHISISK